MARSSSVRLVVLVLRIMVLAALFPLFAFSANEMNSSVLIGNSRIDIVLEKGNRGVPNDRLTEWVRAAAESVTAYYGHFPLPHLLLRITPAEGTGVRNGKTFGQEGGLIGIRVGEETSREELQSDWTLTHEMVHLAFPSVPEAHHWIEEGIATYVEPIARIRAKRLEASQMWFELVRDLPQGLPEAGDKGLDHTHTWGRTYWGGALFCFLADVEIHRQTQNQRGLEDALRGILAVGGDIRQSWDLEKALNIGDRAAGVHVLIPLYGKMKDSPMEVDLAALWKQLGVEREGKKILFDDSAPLAAARAAITYGAASPSSKFDASIRRLSVFAGRTARTRQPDGK